MMQYCKKIEKNSLVSSANMVFKKKNLIHICDAAELVIIHKYSLAKFDYRNSIWKLKSLRFLHIFGYKLEPNREIWLYLKKIL
jgi:hypothetical protein